MRLQKASALLLFLCFLAACSKQSWEPRQVEELPSGVRTDLVRILFLDDKHGYIVGGVRYSETTILETYDAGRTWHEVTLAGDNPHKKIFGLTRYGNSVFAVGVDGKLFKTRFPEPEAWTYIQTQRWDLFTAIAFAEKNIGFVSYGEALSFGGIIRTDSSGSILQRDTFDFELSDILFVSNTEGYACGYGAILKTSDQGATWQYMNIQGDFFKSLSAPTPSTIWSVGFTGSIVCSKNGGQTWETKRTGNNPFNERWYLRSVFFENELSGYAVGDRGLIIRTDDGGNTWKRLPGATSKDLFGLTKHGDHLWVVGENGLILKIEP